MKVTDEMVGLAARAIDPAAWQDAPEASALWYTLRDRRAIAKRKARAALEAALPQWQPIETAARIADLEKALGEALDGWHDAAQYKGDFLREKHGDLEEIARLRAQLQPPPDAGEQKDDGR